MKAKLIFAALTLMFFSCDLAKDCPECMTPPQAFLFNLLDKNSGENLFVNGTFSPDDFQIINVLNQQPVQYELIEEDELGYIQIHSIGWQTEVVNCHFYHKDEQLFTFYVDAVRKSDDCCSFTRFNAIDLEGKEFELDNSLGVYRVFISPDNQ